MGCEQRACRCSSQPKDLYRDVVTSENHGAVVSATTPANGAPAQPDAGSGTTGTLLFPTGRYVGAYYHVDRVADSPHEVHRGGTVHELTGDQFTVWVAAHGSSDAVENNVAWTRQSVEEDAHAHGVADAERLVDELVNLGLLVEVTPTNNRALDFARSHRVVPIMLGLGDSPSEQGMFDIGFLNQPVVEVSHPIYDLWQWSSMDDTLWATCQNAADVARRAGSTDPNYVDPSRLLAGFVGQLHALLVTHAAYIDTDHRLGWPDTASAQPAAVAADATRSEPLIFPIGHYLGHLRETSAYVDVHVVRIGWETCALESAEQVAVWALAHGLCEPGTGDAAPWTRATLEAAARAAAIPYARDKVNDLLSRDLLVEVTPGTPNAVEFAQACRTRSLLIGLGNTPAEPLAYRLAVDQNSAPIQVPPFAYELWKWGQACDSLWHACQIFAAAGDPAHADQVDPERVLSRCLTAIQVLLANGALYLDEAQEPDVQPPDDYESSSGARLT